MNLIQRIEHPPIEDLVPYAANARTHSEDQVSQIAASIKEFGFNNPVLIDIDNGIIAGHGRVMAAMKLGLDLVPTVTLDHLSDAERRAYILADNRLALNAGWVEEILAAELKRLDDEIDLSLLGFDDDELARLLDLQSDGGLTDEDEGPELPETPKTVEGDVWLLGRHRLMCGDSTSIDAVEKLMNGQRADMIYTDPPYGISIVSNGQVGGGGAFGTGKKEKAKGKHVDANKYHEILGDESIDIALNAIQVIKTLGVKVEIIWGGNYYANALENSNCWIVWDKQTGESTFADAELAWTNQKTKVRVFEHRWSGMVKASEHGQKRIHPTQKPIALAEWCIENYGQEVDRILDLFGGSGSTLIACEAKKKNCYMMELSQDYCDVIIKRWQDYTGEQATHEATGKTFDDVEHVS